MSEKFVQKLFFFLITLRIIIFSLSLVIFFNYPKFEAALGSILSVIMILFLVKTRPLESRWNFAQQMICEIIILVVNVSLLDLAFIDPTEEGSSSVIENMSDTIIFCYPAYNVIAILFITIKIIQALRVFFSTRRLILRKMKTFPNQKTFRNL